MLLQDVLHTREDVIPDGLMPEEQPALGQALPCSVDTSLTFGTSTPA
jgi:hypothetical protein